MKKIAMKINGTPISVEEIDNAIQGLSMELFKKPSEQLTEDELKKTYDLAREKVLARELLYQESLAGGFVADQNAVGAEIAKVLGKFPSEKEFYDTLAKAGISEDDYARMIRQDLSINKLIESQIGDVGVPTDEQIKEVYDKHPEKMQSPEQVQTCHILVKTEQGVTDEARAKMESICERIKTEPFSDVAKECSDCPSSEQGGNLGFFQRGSMVPAFEEVAFALEKGEISDVVETQFGLHVIQLVDRKTAQAISLEEASPKIQEFLQNDLLTQHIEKWVGDLKKKAKIEFIKDPDTEEN